LQVLGHVSQAFACGAARCASQVIDRGAARCASQVLYRGAQADARSGNSRSGEEITVRLSGLPEFLASFARSAVDPEGSVGGY
jgi:hypothetical protein